MFEKDPHFENIRTKKILKNKNQQKNSHKKSPNRWTFLNTWGKHYRKNILFLIYFLCRFFKKMRIFFKHWENTREKTFFCADLKKMIFVCGLFLVWIYTIPTPRRNFSYERNVFLSSIRILLTWARGCLLQGSATYLQNFFLDENTCCRTWPSLTLKFKN